VDKYKILFLIHKFVQGGAEQQLFELVKGINKQKFDVIIGCFVPGGEKWEEFNALRDVKIVCFDRKHKFNFFVLWKLFKFLRENPADIIHAYMAPASVYGMLAGLMSRTPIRIIGERGTKPSFPTVGSRIYFLLDQALSRSADLVIANSVAGRECRIEWGMRPERVVVVPNGLNPERLQSRMGITRATLGIDNSHPVLGCVAQLLPKKDHLTLLEAVKIVRQEYPQVKCLLVGDGPLRGQIEAHVQQANLQCNIMFLGQQKHVRDFIEMFDVAVLSSKDTEGCSNFILEAMACGKPVVATAMGGNGELVVDGATGLLVVKEDAQALAIAVLKLLKNQQLRIEFGNAGRQRVEQSFMIEQMIRKTEGIYEQLFSVTGREAINAHIEV
jgi:glycosyltransferase involved in cell wall biosynthesis